MPAEPKTDEITQMWHEVLMHGHRTGLHRLPGKTRCTLCALPFDGLGGVVSRVAGRAASSKNPQICNY